MYAKPSTPSTIGGVLDNAFRLLRLSVPRAWPLALAPAVAVALIDIGLQARMPPGVLTDPQRLLQAVATPGYIVSTAIAILVQLLGNLALIRQVDALANGLTLSPWSALASGVRLLPGAVAAAAMIAIPVTLGLLLLVVPGIYLAGLWLLTFTAMAVEDTGPVASMRRSGRLIRGEWWRTSTAYTVAVVIALAIYLPALMLLSLVLAFGGIDAPLTIGLQRLMGVATSTALALWFAVVQLALFYDLELRRSGADLARRVDALQAD
ncbi:MAG: hypothetical protein KGL34_10120 [Gammaproteobacteria bacterium]|nr:hypothetical protein [Gammaproteobacteria bacterium]